MKTCLYVWALAAAAAFTTFSARVAQADAPAADSTAPAAAQPPSPELQAILRRVDQQDEELRQLRDRLGALQSNQAAAQGPLLPGAPQQLPPVTDPLQPLPPTTAVVPASAAVDIPASPVVFELQERIAALEKKLDEQSIKSTELAGNGAGSSDDGYEVGSDLKMAASWRNGLQFESANKDFRMHIGGRVQYDISAFDNDQALLASPSVGGIGPQPDSTQFRRARVRMDGTMYEVFDWVAEYDFANTLAPASPSVGQPEATVPGLTELSIAWTQLPIIGNWKVGNQREPMGMEHLTSDTFLPFLERSYLRDAIWGPFDNGYTPGMSIYNTYDDKNGTWAIGGFANTGDSFGYGIGDEAALTGRLTWLPYYDEPTDGAYLWHIGISGSTRNPDNGQVRLRVRGDIRSGPPGPLNPIYGDTGTLDAQWQNIIGTETAINIGSFTFQAEYVGTWVEDAVSVSPVLTPRGTPFFQGGYVEVLYFLTGEHMNYNRNTGVFDRVIPYSNAFCVTDACGNHCHGSGAWQIGLRYNAVDLNDNGINGGDLQSFTFGVNWYWNPNAKVQFNYDLTNRSPVKTVPSGDINAFGLRFAYDF